MCNLLRIMCSRVKSDMRTEEGQRHRGDGQSRLDFAAAQPKSLP
jgi:hypothetical protein